MERSTRVSAAALLHTGKVLVVGIDESGVGTTPPVGAELYDPVADAWSPTGPMIEPERQFPTSTLLADGRMLVAGGATLQDDQEFVFSSAEIYDPSINSWSATPDMPAGGEYSRSEAVLLPNGQVLIAGGAVQLPPGYVFFYATAALYDPVVNTWATTAHMSVERSNFTLTLLQNGKVLAAGGRSTPGAPGPQTAVALPTASAEIYDPAAGTWTPVAAMNLPRANHTATLLSNGDVLVVAGDSSNTAVEIYDPNTNTWTEVGDLEMPRAYGFTATLLPSGKVIVAGGEVGVQSLSETESFDQVAGAWSPTASMASGRAFHGASLLQNSTLLVAGGVTSPTAYTASCELYW